MVQALNSVASALIEALRVPDLISMGIVMKKIYFSLILTKRLCMSLVGGIILSTRCQSLGFA